MQTRYDQAEAVLLPILNTNPTVGIMLSGGLDSAVTLWCCTNMIKAHQIKCDLAVYTCARPDNGLAFAEKLRTWIEQDHAVVLSHKVRGSGGVHHSRQVDSAITAALTEQSAVITAETALPPGWSNEGYFTRNASSHPKLYQPWFDLDKSFTVGLAVELNLNYLIEHSHSCVITPSLRCGTCWWCRERAWAFDTLSAVDTGKY